METNSNGTFTVKNKSLKIKAEYENQEMGFLIDSVSIEKDALTNTLTKLTGDVTRISDNTWAGRFIGTRSDDKMKYDITGIDLDDIPNVKVCIADIEGQVNVEN